MKVLVLFEIDEPEFAEWDDDPEEMKIQKNDFKDSVIDGLTSVDMEEAMKDCLSGYYVSENIEDAITLHHAQEVLPSRDKRKLPRFVTTRWGGIRQEGV